MVDILILLTCSRFIGYIFEYMKIAIIGNGGREHAIATKISKSPKISKLYCVPGNAGTELVAENVELDFYNYESLLKFVKANEIDLVIVGPEKPLVAGVVDFLSKKKHKSFWSKQNCFSIRRIKNIYKNDM